MGKPKLKFRERSRPRKPSPPPVQKQGWKFDPTVVQAWAAVAGVLVTLVTSVLIWYVADQQRDIGNRQMRLEYAKSSNRYRVDIKYRLEDGSITSDPSFNESSIPSAVKFDKVGGDEVVFAVTVSQHFNLLVDGNDWGCRLDVFDIYQADSEDPFKLTPSPELSIIENRRRYRTSKGEVTVAAEQTQFKVISDDLFGERKYAFLIALGSGFLEDDERQVSPRAFIEDAPIPFRVLRDVPAACEGLVRDTPNE